MGVRRVATLAERISLALDRRGITQAQLIALLAARGYRVSASHVSQLKTGKERNPHLDLLFAMAGCLEVTVGWLIGETPDKPASENEGDDAGGRGKPSVCPRCAGPR